MYYEGDDEASARAGEIFMRDILDYRWVGGVIVYVCMYVSAFCSVCVCSLCH